MNKSKCPVEGCPRKIDKEGLCIPHREERNKERGIECGFVECDRGATKAGLCDSHYSQKKNGKELTPLQKRRPQQSGPAKCGTRRAYEIGCRCAECREAKRIEAAEWRATYKQKHGKSYYDGRERNRKVYERTCDFCSHTFTTKTYIARYCSLECAKRDAAGWSKSKAIARWEHPYKHWARNLPVTLIPVSHSYAAGNCQVCGRSFVSRHWDLTCSTECQAERDRDTRRARDARRRSLEKSAFRGEVVRMQVFARDAYKCHLCGKRTKADAKVPHPQAPTLDHIVPLAKGGTHEPSNVATACFICNSRKGDRVAGDQLLLFG